MRKLEEELILGQAMCLETLNKKLSDVIFNGDLKFEIAQPIITEIRNNAHIIGVLLNNIDVERF